MVNERKEAKREERVHRGMERKVNDNQELCY